MQITTIEEWAVWHGTLYGFSEGQQPMLAAWINEFETVGYTAIELVAATRSMQASAPSYPAEHYTQINRFVQEQRAKERQKFRSEIVTRHANGERSYCVDCGDSGWFAVPHHAYIADWVDAARFVEAAVLCHCAVARAIIADWPEKKKPLMTLERYMAIVPNWRELVELKHRIDRAKARTAGVSQTAFAKTIDAIARRAAG